MRKRRLKYQYNMFISATKRSLLYHIPNFILRYAFGDRNGVYAMYESIKYRNSRANTEYVTVMFKMIFSLGCSVVFLPFVLLKYAVLILFLGKVYLPRIEVVLTTYCSLKCKDCSNLMQYYDKPYHINADSIIQVLQNLLNSIDSLTQLVLLGGEPLIYPDFVKILEFANENSKIKSVCIKTNGVFKLSDEMIKALKCKKVHLDMSDYGVRSEMVSDNCQVLKKEKIAFFCQDRKPWFNMGDMTKRNRTKAQLGAQYKKCNYKCRCILNGKLYICPRASHGSDLKFFKENIYVDLLNTTANSEELKEKILLLYYYDKPIQACDWCDAGTDMCRPIPCGEQMTEK